MDRGPVWAVATSAILMAGLTACSSGPGEEPPLGPVPTPRSGSQLSLPLDAYKPSMEESVRIERASGLFLRACMRRYGFTLQVPNASVPKYPRNATLLSWIPIQEVSRYGYQGPPGFNAELAAASRNGGQGFIVPPEQMPVFEGTVKELNGVSVPPGGCYGALEQKINAGAPHVRVDPKDPSVQPEQGIEYFQIKANFQARADSRFRALLGKWSACMARSGLNYPSPDSAEGDPRWANTEENGERHKPGAVELRTATADERCRAEVNLSGVLQALISAYERRQIEEHGEVIRKIQQLHRTRVGNVGALTEPFSTCVELAVLEDVDGLGQMTGPVRAAT